MPRLSLYLFGPPRIECDGEPIKVVTRKGIALLAYLALTAERHRRDALVNLLWPESDQSHGRTVLRSTLYTLRKALAVPSSTDGRPHVRVGPRSGQAPSTTDSSPHSGQAPWLDVDRESIGLNPNADVWLDVEQFHRHLGECHAHGHPPSQVCPACLAPLTAAVELYRGDLLSGLTLKDSFNFDDWQFFQTESLRREYADALDRLVRCLIGQGRFDPALRYARQWLALDRLNESAHCQLMRLYACLDQRPAALRQYQECVRVLQSQLDAAPKASTTDLYKAIAGGGVPIGSAEGIGSETAPQLEPAASLEREQPSVIAPTPALVDATKRPVTALLAAVSRPFAKRSDVSPEDKAALVDRLLGLIQDVATNVGAHVERTLGGHVLVVFGATQTRESDPEHAIRAALQIQREAGELGADVSIGINTGEAFVRGIAPGDRRGSWLVGQAVDLAVHLAGQAPPGQILTGESTYRLTRRAFAFTSLALEIVGMDEPLRAYQVERLLPLPQKARGIEGLRAKLIGRDEELAKLKAALAQVLQGRGQIVSLIGEAGVGKSRLVAELREAVFAPADDGPPPLWLEGRCLELGRATSYAPFLDLFRQYLGWGAREADRRRYERVVSSLQRIVERGDLEPERAEEMAAFLGHLLSLSAGGKWEERLESDDPAQIRWRTFLAVRDFFTALCKEQPIVLVFEDLHWADSLSIDLISLLMEELPRASLLLLCVYRPEREHRCWHLATIASQKCRGRYTELTLRELTDRQSRQMVESLLPIEAIPLAVRDMILRQSQGNPFFIEEVVRSLIDAGILCQGEGAWPALQEMAPLSTPESVQSVILSRVDCLDDRLQHVLEVASVIGRVFHLRVLAHTLGQEAELEAALWELEERALIYQERTLPEVEYSFKHVLAQETVYHSILRDRRQGFHRQVAAAIEDLYQANLDEYWEQLAHHYEKSGTIERAISYLLKAGEKAKRSYANEEAIAHLSRGLELLTLTPQTPERARRELDLQIALGVPLVHTKGHAAPEVKATYARAQELCEQVGDAARRFQVLFGLRRACFCRGELQTASTLEEQLLSTAQSLHDPTYVPWVYVMRGETSYWLGEFVQAWEHCQAARGLCDPRQRRSDALVYGNDTGIACRVMGAVALWHLGYPDHALEMSEEALDQAQALGHPFSLVFALYFKALLHQLRREAPLTRQHADAVLRISRERGFALYLAWGTILRGWALTQGHPQCGPGAVVEGHVKEGVDQIRSGIDQMHAGIAAWQATGASVSLPSSLACLAQAHGQEGKIGEAMPLLDEALRLVEENGERCWEAELYRLQGELHLLRGEKEAQVETCFQRAIGVARRQRARSWELRAATSLARLWQGQGCKEKARALLQEIYGWFSEGFETADLEEARALLDALSER